MCKHTMSVRSREWERLFPFAHEDVSLFLADVHFWGEVSCSCALEKEIYEPADVFFLLKKGLMYSSFGAKNAHSSFYDLCLWGYSSARVGISSRGKPRGGLLLCFGTSFLYTAVPCAHFPFFPTVSCASVLHPSFDTVQQLHYFPSTQIILCHAADVQVLHFCVGWQTVSGVLL